MKIFHLSDKPEFRQQIERVFFETSHDGSILVDGEKLAFREKWLDCYLDLYPDLVLLFVLNENILAGYLTGVYNSLELVGKMDHVGYYSDLESLYSTYPAHFHINVSELYQKKGIGKKLVKAFHNLCLRNSIPGSHIVTSAYAENRIFYEACGFRLLKRFEFEKKELVCLGSNL